MSYGEYYPDSEYTNNLPAPVDLVQQKQIADLASFSEYLQALRTHQPDALRQGEDDLSSTIYWDWCERPNGVWTIGADKETPQVTTRYSADAAAAYYADFSDELKEVIESELHFTGFYMPQIGKGVLNDRPIARIYCNIKPDRLPTEASALYTDLETMRVNAYMQIPRDPSEVRMHESNVSITTNNEGLMRLTRVLAKRQEGEGTDAYRPELPKFAAPLRGMSATEALIGISFGTESDVNRFRSFENFRCEALADAALKGAETVTDFAAFFSSPYAMDIYGFHPGCLALNASQPQAFRQLLPITSQV